MVFFPSSVYGKVKLSPDIEFSGNGRNKLPVGGGTLSFHKDKKSYGHITGQFNGTTVQNAYMSGFGFKEPFTGDIVYNVDYNKSQHTTEVEIIGFNGKFGNTPVPAIMYSQKGEKRPTIGFGIIGIGISYTQKADTVTVTSVVPGGPADKAGLAIGDRIIAIDGKNVTERDDIDKWLQGTPNSTVNIEVTRPRNSEVLNFNLNRSFLIYRDFLFSRHVDPSWNRTIPPNLIKASIYKIEKQKGVYDIDSVLTLKPYGYQLIENFSIYGNPDKPFVDSNNKTFFNYSSSYRRIGLKDGTRIETTDFTKDELSGKQIYKFNIIYPDKSKYEGTIQDSELFSNDFLLETFSESNLRRIFSYENIPSDSLKYNNGVFCNSKGEKRIFRNGQIELTVDEILASEPKIIKVEKAGTLLSCISPEELKTIRKMAIVGYLDDTDIKVLTQLGKELVELDLSLAYTTISDRTLKDRAEDVAAISALFGLMGAIADAKYNNGELSSISHAAAKTLSSLVQQTSSDVKVADKNCIIPDRAFDGMPKLVKITLPIWCSEIEDALNDMPSLQYVVLSPKLQEIGGSFGRAFMKCPKLSYLEFPETLNYIGQECFSGTNLRTVNLRKCKWWKRSFSVLGAHCPTENKVVWNSIQNGTRSTLKELWLPCNIECIVRFGLLKGGKLYCPNTLQYCDASLSDITVYCQSSTPFKVTGSNWVNRCTFYVPKGSLTAWYAAFGDTNIIKEY